MEQEQKIHRKRKIMKTCEIKRNPKERRNKVGSLQI